MLPLLRTISRGMTTQSINNFVKQCASGEGYERILQKVNITKVEKGVCIAELKIEKEHTNPLGGLHGGMIASIVDSLTSYALLTHKSSEGIPSVSVDLHVSFLKGAKCGDEILINAHTVKCGKSMGFTECVLTNKATGEIIAKGNHTKYLLSTN